MTELEELIAEQKRDERSNHVLPVRKTSNTFEFSVDPSLFDTIRCEPEEMLEVMGWGEDNQGYHGLSPDDV